MENSFVHIGLIVTYILLAVAVCAALVLPLIYFIKNFNMAKAKNSFISIAILLLVLLVSFFVSSGDVSGLDESFEISSTVFKLIGGSIVTTYILIIGAFLFAIYSEATSRIK